MESFPPLGKITTQAGLKDGWPSRDFTSWASFTVILLGVSHLQGIPLDPSLAGNTEPRPNLQRRLYSHSDSHSPSPHTEQCFCKFREVCFHFDKNILYQNSAQCAINTRWVQISQQGYDRKIRQLEQAFRMSAHPSNKKFILGDFGFYLADLSQVQ